MSSRPNIRRLFDEAVRHHRAGRLQEAETLYRQVLAIDPRHADSLNLLGIIAGQLGRYEVATDLIGKAIISNSNVADFHCNLGNMLRSQGRFDQALVAYHRAAALDPNQATIQVNLANGLMDVGEIQGAVRHYRRAILLNPKSSDAHNNLGTALRQLSQLQEACESFKRAIAINPDHAMARFNLGNALHSQGKDGEAIAEYEAVIAKYPQHAEAQNNLANLLLERGDIEAAVSHYERALLARPEYAQALNGLGNALAAAKRMDDAVACFQRAIALAPDYADAYGSWGNVLAASGRFESALSCLRQSVSIDPGSAKAQNNLGTCFAMQGRYAESIPCFEQALLLNPNYADAQNNLGIAFKNVGRLTEAVDRFNRALAINPRYVGAYNNLGATLSDQGRLSEAVDCYRRALELDAGYETAYSNLLFALNYDADKSGEEIFGAYQEYDRRFGLPHRVAAQGYSNNRDTQRRLKVGYVSPDFCFHPVRHFLEPLLASHDKQSVEIFAYAEVSREDSFTAKYRAYVDHWVPINGMTDDALTERIRTDGIDILVDLAGHTRNNRLSVFARKPAPVSVTWLGYGYTTGLTAIDYIFLDDTLAPTGSEHLFAEKPWRLSESGFVYRPAEDMGPVGLLPALRSGRITFGTLTRAVRINHRTIRTWSEILHQVPNARLAIDSSNFHEPAMREALVERFTVYGINREQLEIGHHSPPWDVLRGMDIGLDCFPHNSGTTLFESLYMGVPFVTLAGRPSVGRLGSSILAGVGHPEWIAGSEEEYIEKAVALAGDLPRLATLRAGLRGEMQASPLMDEAGFARKVEAAYRAMWEKWARENR